MISADQDKTVFDKLRPGRLAVTDSISKASSINSIAFAKSWS